MANSATNSPIPFHLPRLTGYDIEELIGRGGMGRVFRATDLKLGRTVAIKCLLYSHDDQLAERFLDEARAVAQLQHPNIAQLYEFRIEKDQPFIVMEYVAGGTLASCLDGRPIHPQMAAKIVATLARAIDFAHRHGIIHRDLKPGNILLHEPDRHAPAACPDKPAGSDRSCTLEAKPKGVVNLADVTSDLDQSFDVSRLKITDFGLARNTTTEQRLTKTGDIIGTAEYMSPEQATGITTRIGPASDVYSLGAVLYELLTGRPPFVGSDSVQTVMMLLTDEPPQPRSVVSRIPQDVQTICLKCLEKKPARRYASAHELADDLERFAQNEPIRARPISAASRLAKWSRRKPWQAVALSLLVLSAIGAVTGLVLLERANRSTRQANGRLVETNRSLEQARRQTDQAFRLSQDGLQNIVSDISDALYDLPQAEALTLKVVRQSTDLSRRLAEFRPNDLYTTRQLIQALQIQRLTEWLAGNRDSAESLVLELSRLLDSACLRFPGEVDLRIQRVKTWMELDDVSDQEQTHGLQTLEQKITAAMDELLAGNANLPAVHKVASELSNRNLDRAAADGDLPAVLKFADEQLNHSRRFLELAEPAELDSARAWLVKALARAAQYRTLSNDPANASPLLDEAGQLLQQFSDHEKTKKTWRDLQAALYERAGDVEVRRQDAARADVQYGLAATAYRSLVADFPDDRAWQTGLAGVLIQQARLALARNDAVTTQRLLIEASSLTTRVLSRSPGDWLANTQATAVVALKAAAADLADKQDFSQHDR